MLYNTHTNTKCRSFTVLTWASVPVAPAEIGKAGRRTDRMMAANWMRLKYKLISGSREWLEGREWYIGRATHHIGKENTIKTNRSAATATETETRNTLCHCQFIRRWFCPICICICVSFRLRSTKSLPLELRSLRLLSLLLLLWLCSLFCLASAASLSALSWLGRDVSFGWWAESALSVRERRRERNCSKCDNYARFNYAK